MEHAHHRRHLSTGLLLGLMVSTGGCHSRPPAARQHVLADPPALVARSDQGPIAWNTLVDRAAGADVVILGEQHDDAVGHAVQLALAKALLDRCPDGAVAMEMLERDEQPLVSDYRDGIIDEETFATLTGSERWAGKGSWVAWYGPVVDAAIQRDAPLIAANAPRRYVTLARTEGFEAIENLDETRRGLVALPDPPLEGPYRDRFMDHDHAVDLPDEVMEGYFRAQQIWDATMAGSVVDSLDAGRRPVLLLVGRFHSDHGGGTVELIRRGAPDAEVLVISLEPEADPADPIDPAQADIVIFTAP